MAESDHTLKAKAVVEDVFRRADKKDDGALSLKEFQDFFSDGIMTSDELEELFHTIDTSKSNSLSPSELWAYFQQFSTEFEPIFSLIDDLGVAISHAMKTTHSKLHSKELTKVEKFTTRFLIKEALDHVTSTGRPLESASDHLTEMAMKESSADAEPPTVDTKDARSGVKWHKKYQSLCSTGSVHVNSLFANRDNSLSHEEDWKHPLLSMKVSNGGPQLEQFGPQLDRLATLIDKLEGKIKLETVEEEEIAQGANGTVMVLHMSLEVSEDNIAAFRQSLKSYVEHVTSESGCLHVSVQSFAGSYRYSLYEVWQSSEYLSTHYTSRACKTFRKNNVDHLVRHPTINTLELPASWWPDCVITT